MRDFPGNRYGRYTGENAGGNFNEYARRGAEEPIRTKPVLFLDNDFLGDIHGRQPAEGVPSGAHFDARLGAAVLDALSRKYDLRITSTVLAEATAGRPKFRAAADWFWRNPGKVVIYDTPEFMTGPDKGEKSIMSVIMPGRKNYDRSLPPIADEGRLKIASRDRKFFADSPVGKNIVSTQVLLERGLRQGFIPVRLYDWLEQASGAALRRCGGFRSSTEVLGKNPRHRHPRAR